MAADVLRFLSLWMDRGFQFGGTWRFWGISVNPVKDQAKAIGLSPMLLNMLQEVQDDCKEAIIINEGVPATTEGSHVPDSEHFSGEGVDISATYGTLRMKIVKSALKIGFKRIGVYNKHVHLGINKTLPQDVIWGGVSS